MGPITSEQELMQLLNEGKITEEEYRQLLEALHKQKRGTNSDRVVMNPTIEATSFSAENVPWQIWGVVGILGLEGIGNLFEILQNPEAIGWILCKVIFIVGLLRAWRWVFVAFQVIAGAHVLYFAGAGAWGISLINVVLMILCFTALRYYFPVKTQVNDLYHRSIPQEEQSN